MEIIGKAKAYIKLNERYTKIEINDKKVVENNEYALREYKKGYLILEGPKKIIKKDNYKITIKILKNMEYVNMMQLS